MPAATPVLRSVMPGRPFARYRARLHQMVTGLFRATTWRNPAMPATGTNAELTNTTGKIHVNDAAWTASTFFNDRPMHAEIHENVNPTASTRTTTPMASSSPFWNRNPTRYPIAITIMSNRKFLIRSDVVRPASTAERDIGSDRKRSMMPVFMSSASPIAVWVDPKSAFWMKIPGIRNCTYFTPGGRCANWLA